MNAKTIGLVMIVRDEAVVIERCLDSVRPLVDFVLIEDTGSVDQTQTIVRDWLKRNGMPGNIFHETWQNFAYNRSHVMARLRKKHPEIDYALVMDADDQLVMDDDFDLVAFKENLDKDAYTVNIRLGTTAYTRTQICSNRLPFRYRGVLHEFMHHPPAAKATALAKGLHIIAGVEGARSRAEDKYGKDAAVIERALKREQDPFLRSRYTFYLAQSYRDAGNKEKALENYIKRSQMEFWQEEVFISLYNAARLQEALGYPFKAVFWAYRKAAAAQPGRIEPLHGASRLCRNAKRFEDGYEVAKQALGVDKAPAGLFVEHWIYDYGLLDEFAVNAYWAERYEESLQACERLLSEGKMPENMRDRVQDNANFARSKIEDMASVPP